MAALTNYAETKVLELLFENSDWTNIGDASGILGSTTPGNFYIALFTADPTDAGTQTNEATYTSYARVAVARSAAGWSTTGDTVDNVAVISFPECTGGSSTVTHVGIMDASTSGNMIIHGALSSSLAISSGITPQIPIGDLDITAA
jgi:hypothetical protein